MFTRGAKAPPRAPAARSVTTSRIVLALFGAVLSVQLFFLVTSQYDLLSKHSHKNAPERKLTSRATLFGERPAGKGAAGLAASLLKAFRETTRGSVVDGAGFVPVAASIEEDEELSPSNKPVKRLTDPLRSNVPPLPSASASATASKSPAAPSKSAPAKPAAAVAARAKPAAQEDGAPIAYPPPAAPPTQPEDMESLIVGPASIPGELKDWTTPFGKLTDSPVAYITLVSGNSAARHAIVWVQSLLDTGTKHPIVVLLGRGGVGSPECSNATWRKGRGIQTEEMRCDRDDTTAEEIVSPRYIEILKRQGALLQVVGEIPRTKYTATIAGGRHFSWGMSLNKLQIFNMTHFKKLIFMDSDTIAFKNLDHLFGPEYPMFTAAMTYSCCNKVAAPTVSGGFWIVEPELAWGLKLWKMMMEGKPQFHRNGTLQRSTDGSVIVDEWYLSDLDLVRAAFGIWEHKLNSEAVWPMVHDLRHGYVPGLRLMPMYDGWSDDKFNKSVMNRVGRVITHEGFDPQAVDATGKALWDGKTAVFRALDLRYDQCVGHCECLPERDLKDRYFSVHFSCIPEIIHKAAWYENEAHFFEDMWLLAGSCTRYYYIEWFYRLLIKAGARLDPPYWEGPPVPIWNTTHDVFIQVNRDDYKRRGIQRKY